jgi:hypothetical protein
MGIAGFCFPILIMIIKPSTPATGKIITKILLKSKLVSSPDSLPGEVGNGFRMLGSAWWGTKTLKDAKTQADIPLFILAKIRWVPSSGKIYSTENSPSGTVMFSVASSIISLLSSLILF